VTSAATCQDRSGSHCNLNGLTTYSSVVRASCDMRIAGGREGEVAVEAAAALAVMESGWARQLVDCWLDATRMPLICLFFLHFLSRCSTFCVDGCIVLTSSSQEKSHFHTPLSEVAWLTHQRDCVVGFPCDEFRRISIKLPNGCGRANY
jgi:hypothetical protein